MKKVATQKQAPRRAGRAKPPAKLAKGEAPCQHWPNCEGCPFVGLAYPEQLKKKRAKVEKAFLEAGFDGDEMKKLIKPTRSSPLTLGYRNKAKWILSPQEDGSLHMGMYRPGTHDVIDMPQCAVHAPAINELSGFIKHELLENKVPCGPIPPDAKPEDIEPLLRYLIVRYSFREKKLLVVFVTSADKVPGLEKVVKAIETHEVWKDKVVALVQNINADTGNVLLGEANRFLKKSGELTETMGPYRVPVGPLSFLQVNSLQASYLYKRVKELLGPGPFESGLDLYSGVGLIAMHMAPVTKRILAVEEVGPAALEAITAARRNRIGNILEMCGDALEGVSTFVNEWGTPDWVVLNPPRKGCDEQVLAAIVSKPPRKLVYVSCNPATLARDIRLLLEAAPQFSIRSIEPVDMFPQTEHVECLVLLENKSFRNVLQKASSGNQRLKGLRPGSKSLH